LDLSVEKYKISNVFIVSLYGTISLIFAVIKNFSPNEFDKMFNSIPENYRLSLFVSFYLTGVVVYFLTVFVPLRWRKNFLTALNFYVISLGR
jgi:hypothetical protein